MGIAIRPWNRRDIDIIGPLWIETYREAGLGVLPLRSGAERFLRDWLIERLRERTGIGYVAESGGEFAGIVLGSVSDLDSSPPILAPRRVASIDLVFVAAAHRRRGIGSLLIDRAIEHARARNVDVMETTFETRSPAAEAMWRRAGFVSYLVRAIRELEG